MPVPSPIHLAEAALPEELYDAVVVVEDITRIKCHPIPLICLIQNRWDDGGFHHHSIR